MTTRKDAIEYCLTFPLSYEDYPFDDFNWTVMRRSDTKKGFCWIFEREGRIWLNVKAEPSWAKFWRDSFPSVLPAYHMNKEHWNSIILDGTIPEDELYRMISDSYYLCGKNKKEKK